jgi:RNA polymerase sigma factor (sigma-70 family)
MVEKLGTRLEGAESEHSDTHMSASAVLAWFLQEVLPLETILMRYLRHNWRDQSDIEDLLQDVYVRVFEAARREIPEKTKSFVFTTARNLLVDRVRERRVVPMDAVSDLDALGVAIDTTSPDQNLIARDELRLLREAIEMLPPRYRDVVVMRKIEDLPRSAIASRLGVAEATVSIYLAEGISALSDIVHGDQANLRSRP